MSKKPLVVIRIGGYYVNCIENKKECISRWRKDNVIRSDFDAEPNKDGTYPQMKMLRAIKERKISFIPATEVQAAHARGYDSIYKNRYGYPGEYAGRKNLSGIRRKTGQRS